MRTLKISRNNIGLRFFLWVWGAKPSKLNVCKLFWGTVFLPLGFFVKESNRPFYYLSSLAAIWLVCIAIPSILLGKYFATIAICLLISCSLLYNYVRREAIAKKCDQQEAENKTLDEENKIREMQIMETIESGEHIFSERTERILEIIFYPIFRVCSCAIDVYERFYSTKHGKQITGLLSLFYHFLKSVKQNTCLLVKVV